RSPPFPSLPPAHPRFPYTTLFRSRPRIHFVVRPESAAAANDPCPAGHFGVHPHFVRVHGALRERVSDLQGPQDNFKQIGLAPFRSEEHTSELQSRVDIVCRLLLEQ